MNEASLYIHIPFCKAKCGYCDFFSVDNASPTLIEEYINALLKDIEAQILFFKIEKIPTIYIGGGTPSVLDVHNVTKLLSFVNKKCSPFSELTVEANSESLNADFIAACISGGVTRLSIGVQTFNDNSRIAINRIGSSIQIKKNLDLIYLCNGKIDISFDLMSGLPHQDKKILISDIQTILQYNPAHISLYDLILEEETPLFKKEHSFLPPPETSENLWILGRDTLENAGYLQYEVSNFCKAGKESLHNMRYWTMQNWLGCGACASGTIFNNDTAVRRTIISDIKKYIAARGLPEMETEFIDRLTLQKETIMMGYRCLNGPDETLFKKRFSLEIAIPKTIAAWKKRGLYSENKNALNKGGLLFLNSFLSDAFTEIDGKIPNEKSLTKNF
jgi:oxygen-independent coproporphyrinogen-3 oxidase